jgi:hypothetical protein
MDIIGSLAHIRHTLGSIKNDQFNYKFKCPELADYIKSIEDKIIIKIRSHKRNEALAKARTFKQLIKDMKKK